MTAILMFLAAVVVLMPLIALHEWGHYIVARLCGVKVLTYSIGFGKQIIGFRSKKTGINYRICAIPLGGYVKMLDERQGAVPEHQKHLAFNNQHPLKKIAIVIAGPLMNFLIAIGLFFVLFIQPSENLATKIGKIAPNSPAANSVLVVGDNIVSIDGKPIEDWQAMNLAIADRIGESGHVVVGTDRGVVDVAIDKFMQGDGQAQPLDVIGILPWQPVITPIIGEVVAGGAADLMGLKQGDIITTINGIAIDNWLDAVPLIRDNPEHMLVFGIMREGQAQSLEIMPRATTINGKRIGQIGVQVKPQKITIPEQYKITTERTIGQAFTAAIRQSYEVSLMTLRSLGKMLSGIIGLDNLSGPITIAEVSKTSIEMGLNQVLYTAAMISLSLAVLNLLPIPVLDGGHILYALYELVAGKPLSERVQVVGLNLGMLMLLGFMLIAIGNDIGRVFG